MCPETVIIPAMSQQNTVQLLLNFLLHTCAAEVVSHKHSVRNGFYSGQYLYGFNLFMKNAEKCKFMKKCPPSLPTWMLTCHCPLNSMMLSL